MPRCRESRDPRRVSVGPVPPAAAVPPLFALARRGGQTIRSSESRAAGLHRSLKFKGSASAPSRHRVSCLAAARQAAHAHAARKRGSNETRITDNRRCAIAVVVAGRPRAECHFQACSLHSADHAGPATPWRQRSLASGWTAAEESGLAVCPCAAEAQGEERKPPDQQGAARTACWRR